MDPNLPDIHNNLGVLLMRLGQPEEALASYRKAIALVPGLPEVHNNLGNALLALDQVAKRRTATARRRSWRRASRTPMPIWAAVLQALGQWAEAIAHFRRARKSHPRQPEILANLALAHLAQGDHRAAMDAIIRSLSLGGNTASQADFRSLRQGFAV